MNAVCNSLIAELEEAVHSHAAEKRVETLRRVTDLFLRDADRLNDDQIAVFDDVLGALIQRIETKALAQLSSRLAPIDKAPIEVIRSLARHDEILVAGPVLTESARLTAGDLIEVARTKSQNHLLAISGRSNLEEGLTDVLLTRGNKEVAHRLADNSGARFSEFGFEVLVKAGSTDAVLAERLGLRIDLPVRLLRQLLLRATEAVRARIMSVAAPEAKDEIRRVLATISNEVCQEVTAPRDLEKAMQLVLSLQERDELDEAAILGFVKAQQYEEMIAGLSVLSGAPIEIIDSLVKAVRSEGLLIPCKAAALKWPTVSAILKNRGVNRSISDDDLAQCRTNFIALSQATAQRVLRFWIVRNSTSKPPDGPAC